MGTLIVPNTVSLIAGGPNAKQGAALIDYLLHEDTEKELIRLGWCHVSLRSIPVNSDCMPHPSIRPMSVSLSDVHQHLDASRKDLQSIFIR
jgi:iron(III) transport system substrate-binding protein